MADDVTRARIAALRLQLSIAKAGPFDDGKHPRFPKGDPHGGQFAPKGSLGSWFADFFGYGNHIGGAHDVADPNWGDSKGPQEPYYTQDRKGAVLHPDGDYKGRPVYIYRPSEPTPLAFKDWKSPDGIVTVTPGAPVPKALNGVAFTPFDPPEDWRTVAGQHPQLEDGLPDLDSIKGKHPAAGVIVQEPDGRVWLTKPTNGFGGYKHTFPKGTQEDGLTLQQTAIKEAWEETGLKVEIVGVLGDFERTTSTARYYIARRVGGTPANQGWESQAMRLVPPDKIISFLNMPVDRDIWRTYYGEQELTKERVAPFVDRASLAALQARIDALAVTAGIAKAFDDAKHPRYPKGSPLGGQFMAVDDQGVLKPPVVGSKANPGMQNKVNAAYAAVKAGDMGQLAAIKASLQAKVDKYGYDAGKGAQGYGAGPHSQAKWAQQAHQYVTSLGDAQKSALVANLTTGGADKGGTSVPSLDQYKKIEAKPGGSNPGAVYEGPDGSKYLVKGAKHPSDDRAKNEVLASKLMQAAGIKAPDMHLVDLGKQYGGGLGVASKMEQAYTGWHGGPSQKAAAQSEFAVHAWLANYDAVGTPAGDNLSFMKDGKPFNYDPGGALLYRAQGAPKPLPGGMLPTAANEWNSMRDKSVNPAAASIYGSMTAGDLQESAKKLQQVDDKTITDLVAKYGPGTPEKKLQLAAVLTARRDDILAKAGLGGNVAAPAPAVAKPAPKVSALYGDNISAKGQQALLQAKEHIAAYNTLHGDNSFTTISGNKATAIHDALANAKTVDDFDTAFKSLKDWNPVTQHLKEAKQALLDASTEITVHMPAPASAAPTKAASVSLAHLSKLGAAADAKITGLSTLQGWAAQATQAKMAIDHGIEHGDGDSVGNAWNVINSPGWQSADKGSKVGDAKAALEAYATAADKHIVTYGGSNYQAANAARHAEAQAKGESATSNFAQAQGHMAAASIVQEASGFGGFDPNGNPLHKATLAATTAFYSGDDKGMATAMGTIATSGFTVSEPLYDKLHELASTKADQFPLSTGVAASVAAKPALSADMYGDLKTAIGGHDLIHPSSPFALHSNTAIQGIKLGDQAVFDVGVAGLKQVTEVAYASDSAKVMGRKAIKYLNGQAVAAGLTPTADWKAKPDPLSDEAIAADAAEHPKPHAVSVSGAAPATAAPTSIADFTEMPPPAPNFQHTTKTAVAYYQGVTDKMLTAYSNGDMAALEAAATKPGTSKPVWPVFESGAKAGLPKSMNGKLLAEYHANLVNMLNDAQGAKAAADLAKPTGAIPSPGENKGSLPAMPSFDRAMIATENSNAASHNAKVHQIKVLAQKGDVKGLLALNYGTNTYGKKQAALANDTLKALGSDLQVTPGQKKNSHYALTSSGQSVPITSAPSGHPLSAALTDKELPPKVDFANYNGTGKGLSSKPAVNAANQAEYDKLLGMAKAGDVQGIKKATFQPIDAATGAPVGQPKPISDHPSQHIKNLQDTLLQTMDEKLHPPEPLKFFTGQTFKDIHEVAAKVPPKPFGTTSAKHPASQTIGYFLALGQVTDPTALAPEKTFNLTPEGKAQASADYSKMSYDAQKFVGTMQSSGGKKFAHPASGGGGYSAAEWEKITVAAHKYATQLPVGTTLYKWDNLTPDMKQKLALSQPGLIIQNPAPVCTSYSPTSTKGFGPTHRFKIIVGPGAKVISSFASGSFSGEGELSLLPNNRFMVLSHKKTAGAGWSETTVLLLPPDPALEAKAKLLHY